MPRPLLALLFVLASPGALALTTESNVTVNGKQCDAVSWTDADGRTRTIWLVRADGDTGSSSGGYVERYRYDLGSGERTGNSDEGQSIVSGTWRASSGGW